MGNIRSSINAIFIKVLDQIELKTGKMISFYLHLKKLKIRNYNTIAL